MDIFWRLLLAHLLADFTLQTDRLAAWKRRSAAGCLAHSLVFGACAILLCAGYLGGTWIRPAGIALNGWAVVALLTAIHFAEDQYRVWSIRRNAASDSFSFFLWDQMVHIYLIYLCAPSPAARAYPLIVLGILAVLATHFTSILLYYASGKVPAYARQPSLMLQRLATGCLALIPSPVAVAGAFAWTALVAGYYRRRPGRAWGYALAGNLLVLVLALLLRRLL